MESVVERPDWHNIDLVVFDLDGTLYDQRLLRALMFMQVLLHTLRSMSLHVPKTIRAFRLCREELAERPTDDFRVQQYELTAARRGCSAEEVRELISEWMERRPLSVILACRFAGIERLFGELNSRRKTIAVLSDYPAAAKLDALGLRANFVISAYDDDVGRLKPDPTGLYKIMKLAGAEAQRSLMIGDRFDRDGEVARRAGMHALIKSGRPEGGTNTFRSYNDEVFRPLFGTDNIERGTLHSSLVTNGKAILRELRERVLGYTLVGGLAALVDVATFHWLNGFLHPVFLASATSFLLASVIQYLIVSVAVYRKAWRSARQMSMFSVVTVVGLLVNSSATAALAGPLAISPDLAKVGGICLAFGVNFVLTTFVVFRK